MDTSTSPLVQFRDVNLGYGRNVVLSGLDFTLYSGGYVGIVGPNGAGKTTLLRGILGTLKPLSGAVEYGKRPTRFGYVPQAQTMDETFPLTALDIVLMGRYRDLGLVRRPARDDVVRAEAALEQVGIADLGHRLFREFSGGQRQRTLMARALASEPDVLVLDEPTNDMDVAAEHATMELVDRLHAERGMLVLMVSHLLNVVVNHVHDMAIVGAGETHFELGSVEDLVTPEQMERIYGMRLAVGAVNGKRVVL
ncbi:MAG TPA: metal ABC transporter ATP-binding protein [Armatimonadota bacterium]|jgi:ABC-type Mn2+/Zn2+ transport system ATPase subunit